MKAEEIRTWAREINGASGSMDAVQVQALFEIAAQLATLNEFLLRLEKEMEG